MAEKLIKCRVVRDFWNANGERVAAGAEVHVTVEQALDGVECGALSRVKEDRSENPRR